MSDDPPIPPHAHGAEPHVEVGEPNPEQTQPGPKHVSAVQTTYTAPRSLSDWRASHLVAATSDEMSQGVAAEGVAAEQHHVGCENQRSDADAKGGCAVRVREPQGLPDIGG